MRKFLAILGALLLVSSGVFAADADVEDDTYEDEERALLIVHKLIVGDNGDLAYPLLVQGRNVTVKLFVYNSGSATASDVSVTDVLPPNAELLDGKLSHTWAKIAAGSQVESSYVLKFTSGGSMDVQFLPQATVNYKADSSSEQVGESSRVGIFLLTPVQQIQRYALIVGTYASLGICRTPEQWRNMAIFLAVVGAVIGGNAAAKGFSTTRTNTRRKKALQELEKQD
uniref:Translocon-associated protein subunit alpha n=1 Tax=Chlamydomonas leiostraca TaxID=1034604 RepID=A0A7S0RVC1_9CHLO|mmetsp:Transcript_31190/g.79518  ORF Transcript_31190/g.79518 Transcript_31190/m.79518 type:complete len:227 (+) Transcript_31190:95-775(+)|eukprot:CAMPEP_0202867892 /NCGR_PEP_ID=MMETSP1391-20130828/9687_1 /ASSEMBLY_ACC=CAM_ASM_000867 /TAXON_ID=1034604 /ORGANISM="Chlamydomonas leiostraca, Strain SAG 11-49" /LENGTH=226 /DNA_ID=CAMNT_0049547973 /DNA_START=95 /DNA_END=775 /DNA_ORIENTATION=-